MKYILSALFLVSISAPLSFGAEDDCGCKSKAKKESTLAPEDCKDGCKGKKKEEGTLLVDGCSKCKEGAKKEEAKGTLA